MRKIQPGQMFVWSEGAGVMLPSGKVVILTVLANRVPGHVKPGFIGQNGGILVETSIQVPLCAKVGAPRNRDLHLVLLVFCREFSWIPALVSVAPRRSLVLQRRAFSFVFFILLLPHERNRNKTKSFGFKSH